ncbi:flagellar basal body P-ring formation chaperone FlgA [Blastochloris viridis]|uniref:Flagellar basal body P-ring biosynthesis proteinFlgA n=1 Tax=Blastochloris viridis TaxID=1079 RepID=A0A0H5BCB5_BLAVI|nr:flagellar basal body P-ring formation chaperone FlgA [Blastochloris viridis]ALK08787.1 flagellar basal body P-ring biosynthesis protein FlgA [Blastochloris viridis]BAR97916.1 flagellar basal-body P-ring formation protein FlgA [Blastochloris viridis]CUU41448.1 flagellar basal body P-ring biosynthesis proteinFlgA [Blastochloris viridis]
MIRPFALLAALFAATNALAQAPTLRSSVTVAADVVRIGDLIDHAGRATDVAVFRSPDLGTTGSVGVDRVLEAVRPHGLDAIDTHGLAEVVVTRRSRILHPDTVKAALAEAIARESSLRAKDLDLALDRPLKETHVEETATANLQVVRLSFDPRSGRFDAGIEVPGSDAARRQALRISGVAVVTTEAVVLARSVARGEALRDGDLIVERRPRSELANDGFVSADSAIGMAPRRALQAGQMLRAADLVKPDLVSRNDIVNLVFAVPGVSLTTRGKANSSGAEGDIVSVTNLQSKRIIQGAVTAPGTVTVSAGPTIASSALGPTDPTVTGSTPVRTEIIRPSAQPRS